MFQRLGLLIYVGIGCLYKLPFKTKVTPVGTESGGVASLIRNLDTIRMLVIIFNLQLYCRRYPFYKVMSSPKDLGCTWLSCSGFEPLASSQ
jgi:hypothetical protein